MRNFNSIKVRLEPTTQDGGDRVPTFQFHKGTIRTWCGVVGDDLDQYFNSIKVRLEPYINKDILLSLYPFQFHKGTIRT